MSEIAVGIDLGTSNSCVAIHRDGKVEVLANAFGEHTTASVVAFPDDGSITVGNSARAKVIHDPQHTISSAKRLIGRYFFSEEVKKAQAIYAYEIIEAPNHGVRIKIREEAFSLPEISAMVLREMKQIAEARIGEPVTKAVITVPAYFNDNQRQATKDAGKIAGLEVLRILNEPTAAALAYGFGRGLNQRVAVYDLGGGTFDISVLEIGRDIFEVLSTCGDTFLGGDDLDDRLIDLVADEFMVAEGLNLRDDPFAFEKLRVACEGAKKGLSVDDEVQIRIPDVLAGADGNPRSIERRITADEFSALVKDLVLRTFKVCDEALQQADLTVRDLDGVILVGGPTRLPVIRKAVEQYFQRDPAADVDPDEVVAMGAAIHAGSLVNSEQDAVLLDVTPLDLRIGVAGGLAEPVIESNTPVPIEQTRRFTTFQDHQQSVKIRVYQGGSRHAEGNELLGEFEFSGFEIKPRGEVDIDVTFEINADGIVSVTALDPASGQRASTEINLSSGLSDEDLEQILEEDPTARLTTVGHDTDIQPVSEPVAATPAEEPLPEADDLDLFADGDDESEELELARDESEDLELLGEEDDLDLLCEDGELDLLDNDQISALAEEVELDLEEPITETLNEAAVETPALAPTEPGVETPALALTDAVTEPLNLTGAVSVADLDGDPTEVVPLGSVDANELAERPADAVAGPDGRIETDPLVKDDLFDIGNTNLSGDEEL